MRRLPLLEFAYGKNPVSTGGAHGGQCTLEQIISGRVSHDDEDELDQETTP